MSFKALLDIDGSKNVRVLECEYGFSQDVDQTGLPNARPKGGVIKLVIESSDEVSFLFSWMISNNEVKKGTISFFRRDHEAAMKKITFEDAVCISYLESFRDYGSVPMTIALTISARVLSIDGESFENHWNFS